KTGTDYDTINGDGTGATAITLDTDNADNVDVYTNTAVITDTKLMSNAYETFVNERKGTIPTGIDLLLPLLWAWELPPLQE
ncbi:MAG: hypothetical protein J6M07_06420, partial [Ruminococcus sp.]|nr:hypothetical protein [Ruminococcus sp.]